MGRIRILPDQVANKIAAGEVVERPASVVKELLENSLDAGATDLRIEVEAGGRRLIRIADDGCGMLRDDALLAFERHATSKLRDVKDLLSIATLGSAARRCPPSPPFPACCSRRAPPRRPPARASRSPAARCCAAKRRRSRGGTAITVRDLFYNVPARKKFLRTEQTELAHIASLVTHYSLAHPDKTFQLTQRRRRTAHVTPVATLGSASTRSSAARCWTSWSSSAMREKELLCRRRVPPSKHRRVPKRARRAARRTFRLSGFVSRPQVQKANRNSIYIFVNGRLIRDRLLLHALSSAYHNLMPPRRSRSRCCFSSATPRRWT